MALGVVGVNYIRVSRSCDYVMDVSHKCTAQEIAEFQHLKLKNFRHPLVSLLEVSIGWEVLLVTEGSSYRGSPMALRALLLFNQHSDLANNVFSPESPSAQKCLASLAAGCIKAMSDWLWKMPQPWEHHMAFAAPLTTAWCGSALL